MEDVISADFYHKAVCETYPDKPIDRPASDGKRSRAYAEAYIERYNIGFNKRRVGNTIKRLLQGGRGLDKETRQDLTKLGQEICDKCLAQVSTARPEEGKSG